MSLFTYIGQAITGKSRFKKGKRRKIMYPEKLETRREPDVVTGEYTTAYLPTSIVGAIKKGSVLYLDDTSKKLAYFKSGVSGKSNYDLFVATEDVTTVDGTKITVIATGNIYGNGLVVDGGDLDTVIDGCTIKGWLGNKFVMTFYNTNDNKVK